jgi:uncharacterized protein (TIGR03435 family)
MRHVLGILISLIVSVGVMGAQSQGPQPDLRFSVTAIHPTQPGVRGGGMKPAPNGTGYLVQNESVKMMMAVTYRIPSHQITGGPAWFSDAQFDVEAKADGNYNADELHTMFKNMLADRFGLKFHTETKQGAIYELVVDKSGMKMKADGSAGTLAISINPTGPDQFVGTKVPMEYLCWFIGQLMPNDVRPVIDKTGLAQVYDFTLAYTPNLPPGGSSADLPPEMRNLPAFQDALVEQLGLRLVPAKGPVLEYVIDQVSQPSEN